MIGFLLFIVALILTTFLFVISVIFTPIYFIFTLKWKAGLKRFGEYWMQLAISIDQFGNGACGKFLQFTMVKERYHSVCYNFGNIDETVSFVLGENKHRGYLNKFGMRICKILHILDKNHVEKAIDFQKVNDKRAFERHINDDYAI